MNDKIRFGVPHNALCLNLFGLGIVILLLMNCGGNADIGDSEVISASSVPTPETAFNKTQVRDISLTALDNRFDPAQIRVGSGEAIRIIAFNQGLAPHTVTLQLEGQEVDLSMLTGENQSTETIKVLGKPGTVIPFRCRWHASSDFKVGMVGTILVVDDHLADASGVD